MVDSSGTTTYTYNAGNRLTLITDPSSNLTTNTYDNNGNLTVTNANGTVTTNTWTYGNRLRTVTLATPATTTFTYDGDGLRRQTVTAAGTTNFIWDGQDVLLETDVSNNTQVTYTQTPDIYGNLVSQRRGDTTTFYHHDALGSTLALTVSDESVTDTYRYYAFGETLTSTGSTTNPFQYVGNLGYYNEAALSLQYLRARYYQPSTGRFVSADPVHEGTNWYVYADASPVSVSDPSGLRRRKKEYERPPDYRLPTYTPCYDFDCIVETNRCVQGARASAGKCTGKAASDHSTCDSACTPLLAFGPIVYGLCIGACAVKFRRDSAKCKRKIAAYRNWCAWDCEQCMQRVGGTASDCTDRSAL